MSAATEPRASVPRGLWLLAAAVLGTLLVLAVRRLELARVGAELANARPGWVLAALLCFTLLMPLWALQWWLLAPRGERSTPARMLGVVAMTSSVLNTTPMLVGEAAAVQFLSSHAGVDRAAGLAVLAMDQLLVGLAKVCVLLAAASFLPLPPAMRDGLHVLAGGVGILLVALLTVAWTSGRGADPFGGRLDGRAAGILARAAHALAPLRSPTRGGAAFALALLKKGCELLAILALQRAFGVVLPPSSALLVLAALNLATLLPIVPGNAGVFEAAIVLAYGWQGVPAERALGMALVQHACFFVALALPGYWWLARTVSPARNPAAAP